MAEDGCRIRFRVGRIACYHLAGVGEETTFTDLGLVWRARIPGAGALVPHGEFEILCDGRFPLDATLTVATAPSGEVAPGAVLGHAFYDHDARDASGPVEESGELRINVVVDARAYDRLLAAVAAASVVMLEVDCRPSRPGAPRQLVGAASWDEDPERDPILDVTSFTFIAERHLAPRPGGGDAG